MSSLHQNPDPRCTYPFSIDCDGCYYYNCYRCGDTTFLDGAGCRTMDEYCQGCDMWEPDGFLVEVEVDIVTPQD